MIRPPGPESPRPPFIPPQPPSPDTRPTSPQPVHPEHSALLGDTLAPPDDIGRPPATQPTLRPSALSKPSGLQQVVESPEATEQDPDPVAPSGTPNSDHSAHEPRTTLHDIPHRGPDPLQEQTPDTLPVSVEERAKPTEVAHPVPLTNAVEIKMPAAEQPVEIKTTRQLVSTVPLYDKIAGYSPLPPHPSRIEESADLQAAKDAGQAVTQIILVEHTGQNGLQIADNARDCDILALEAILRSYTSQERIESLERAVTDLLSSDPTKSAAALESLNTQHDTFGKSPYMERLLDNLRDTDVTVKLIDIARVDPAHRAALDAADAADAAWIDVWPKVHQIPSQKTSGALLESAQGLVTLNELRNPHFAQRLDDLRREYPDKDINFVTGKNHYRLAAELDETHRHALFIGSPISDNSYFADIMGILYSKQPVPAALMERATLQEIYESAAGSAGYEKLVQPIHLSKGHPDHPTNGVRKLACDFTREFLIDNMTDEQVHDALGALDRVTTTWTPRVGRTVTAWKRQQVLAQLARTYSS